MNSLSLMGKVKRTINDDGAAAVVRKAKNYLTFKIQAGFRKEKMKDILFVNGCTLPHPERYRVDHQIEQLEANGLTAEKILYTELKPEMIKLYRGVVIFRCPITENVKKLIEKARYFNKKVFFDIDDLVIDKKYTDKIEYVQKMNKIERAEYDDGVMRMGETMKLADYCITTTPALKRELEKYGKEVFINKNVASEKMLKLSIDARKENCKKNGEIVIGYLSGSITHNPDFELVKPALIKIMDEYKNVKLCLMGHLDLPKDLERFGDRIVRKPFEDWRKLPDVIAGLDINLAPIEETIFNEAKSENKWTEAALCKVVTVASDFGAFKNVIEDGKTGILCKNGEEWYRKLKQIIEEPGKRLKIANNAYKKAKEEYITTYTGKNLADYIEKRLVENISFVVPSVNVSGGINVILRHCDILRRNGKDVTLISMDKDEDNIINSEGEINVVSGVKHNVLTRYDIMVATLFTTVRFVKSYPDVKKKCYLVQSFETEFEDYGSSVKREANATYNEIGNINYLTISKWCKKWLEDCFGQKAKYAPNGIDTEKFDFKERSFEGEKIRILIEGNSDNYYKNVDESFRVVEKLDRKKYEIVYLSYKGEPKSWYKIDRFYHKISYDKVENVYKDCDILLKTSILEGFSYPPLEMMATGGYVVAVANEGNKEYLCDGENGLLYEQGEIERAVELIERLSVDKKLRERLSQGARKTVRERDWKNIENKILGLYK